MGLAEDLVDLDQQRGALVGVEFLLGGLVGLVRRRVRVARDVATQPLVLFVGDLPGDELVEEALRIGLRLRGRVHLHVDIELGVGVGVGHVGREEHRGSDRLQLEVDAGALAGLLDDLLRLLARRVDRGLEDVFELLAILFTDAVGAALVAGVVQDLVRLVDVELVFELGRLELGGRVDEARRRGAAAAIDELLDRVAVDQQVDRLAHLRIRQGRMLGLDAGALAIDLGPRIRGVEDDELDVARRHGADLAAAAGLHALEDLVLDLEVPGIVVFAGLQHGARRRDGVTAALDLERVEMRLVGDVVVGVALAGEDVAGLELGEPVGAGADGLQVRRSLARLGALELAEMMLGQNLADGADEGVGPERGRILEDHLDRQVVDLLDLDVLVGAGGVGRGRRIGGIFPGEDDVVGSERLAVMPLDARLQLPGDFLAVRREAAIGLRGNLGRQAGDEIAVLVPAGERLEEDARGDLVLGA